MIYLKFHIRLLKIKHDGPLDKSLALVYNLWSNCDQYLQFQTMQSHLHLAWMALVVWQVSVGLEYHQENNCGFAKYHLLDASVYNQAHSFQAAISCLVSYNESHISFKVLGLLKYAAPKSYHPW